MRSSIISNEPSASHSQKKRPKASEDFGEVIGPEQSLLPVHSGTQRTCVALTHSQAVCESALEGDCACNCDSALDGDTGNFQKSFMHFIFHCGSLPCGCDLALEGDCACSCDSTLELEVWRRPPMFLALDIITRRMVMTRDPGETANAVMTRRSGETAASLCPRSAHSS